MKPKLTPLQEAINKLEKLKKTSNFQLTDFESSYNDAIDDAIDTLIEIDIMLERKANLQEQINQHEGGFQGGIPIDGLSGFRG